ncbi:MAG: hypothetical protein A4E42_01869 [Methanoregulaceae archaeon PtaU1.Bin222]|nr:MAG: hypothetical protein A4E42_01869 [Methanoregulaceae archaeon PtaU1.Bin222]
MSWEMKYREPVGGPEGKPLQSAESQSKSLYLIA